MFHTPGAAEAGRVPVLDGGVPRIRDQGYGEPSPRTGNTGLSWPPEGLHSAAHGHHIYRVNEYKYDNALGNL